MVKFIDGPAAGTELALRRAPMLLRVVIGPRGATDALDQPADQPHPKERIVVYRATERVTGMFVRAGGRGGKALSGYWPSCSYAALPESEQPADSVVRDAGRWAEWSTREMPRLCADLLGLAEVNP